MSDNKQSTPSTDATDTTPDALRKAIEKLKAQGKIITPPEDEIVEDDMELFGASKSANVAVSSSSSDDESGTDEENTTKQLSTTENDDDDVWELPGDETMAADDDLTTEDVSDAIAEANAAKAMTASDETPWTLQQFFDGEIDLDVELSKRFPNMPLMASVKFRNLGSKTTRKVATLQTQDGSASIVVDADVESKAIQISFTYGSMMTLRYSLAHLSDADRSRWLELMRRDQGGLAFLWGPSRWQNDYLICIGRKYFTNVYAFSPNSFESAVRVTPAAMTKLLDWLDDIWEQEPGSDDDDDQPLLTW